MRVLGKASWTPQQQSMRASVRHLHAPLAAVETLGYWLDDEVEATWALAPAWNLHNHREML